MAQEGLYKHLNEVQSRLHTALPVETLAQASANGKAAQPGLAVAR